MDDSMISIRELKAKIQDLSDGTLVQIRINGQEVMADTLRINDMQDLVIESTLLNKVQTKQSDDLLELATFDLFYQPEY
jgi:hypothetical protein